MVRRFSYNVLFKCRREIILVMMRLPASSFLSFFLCQLHSSSSDEAISSRAGKGQAGATLMEEEISWINSREEKKKPEAATEEGTSRVSIEIEEEEAERIRKAQTKIR